MRLQSIYMNNTQIDDTSITEILQINDIYLHNLEILSFNYCYLLSNGALVKKLKPNY